MANSIKQVSQNCFRVLLDALAGDASVTIGFSDKTVAANLSMEAPDWQPRRVNEVVASLQDLVKVNAPVPTSDVTAAVPISVVKTGTTHADFVITLHNDTAATLSGTLELYIEYVH